MSTNPAHEIRSTDDHDRSDGTIVVCWGALAGDRWSTLQLLGQRQPVVVELPWGAAVDPLALLTFGARAVIHPGRPEELAMARTAIRTGGSYLSPTMVARRPAHPSSRRRTGTLGPREAETLRHLVEGLTHRQVARELGVTAQTVGTYAKRLRRKLGATNLAELTQRAVELGYLATTSTTRTTSNDPRDENRPASAAARERRGSVERRLRDGPGSPDAAGRTPTRRRRPGQVLAVGRELQ